jgi:NADPH:quinone reductase-like Zn-dependent oxidoreductase
MPKMKGVWFDRTLPNLTEIRDLDIPEPGDDEILVKNVAVASNPKDWKGPLVIKPDWTGVEGNDFSGIVAKVGANVTRFQPGSRVAGFTKMFTDTKYGV